MNFEEENKASLSYSSSQLEVRVVSVLGAEVPHVGTELVSQPLPLHHLDLLVAVVVPHRPRQLLVVHGRVLLHLEGVSFIWHDG